MFETVCDSKRAYLGGVLTALAVLAATGCQTTASRSQGSTWLGKGGGDGREKNRIDSTGIETRDDIVQIVSFWNQPYWLQDSERVRGFKTTVYFVSGQTEKGAFVPGNILVWIYELTPTGHGNRTERKLVHGWQFNEREARPIRVNRRAVGGYYYGMPLQWPSELHLEGKQVEIQIGYERLTGGVVLSSPRRFKTPVPINYQGDMASEPRTEP